jgi:integrase
MATLIGHTPRGEAGAMEWRDGQWVEVIEVTSKSKTEVTKRAAALRRALKKLEEKPAKPRRAHGEGTLHQRPNGLWRGQLPLPPGPDGKRRRTKPVYNMDRAVVIDGMHKVRQNIEQGLDEVDKRLTVQTWLVDMWIDDIAKPKLSPNAYRSYVSAIRTRIVPAIGKKYLATLKPEHIRFMHKWILDATYTRGKGENAKQIPYTTRSVEEAHNVLSAALTDAVREGRVHRNVCELVSKPAVISKSHGDLTAEQARTLLMTAYRRKDPMVTRWAAGLMLGGRQGELLGLQWDRVDLELGTLDLAYQLDWLKLKPGADPDDPDRYDIPRGYEHIPLWRGAALTRPKSKKSLRIVPLPEPLAAILTAYRKIWEPNPWNLVWTSSRGTPIGDSVDLRAWRAALTAAQLPTDIDIHAMRGTTATLLLEAKVDAHVVQSILGHSKVATTRGYQRVDIRLQREALGQLSPLLELG